jgi:hypothetical protein
VPRLLRDASLYDLLLTFDHDLAAEARGGVCLLWGDPPQRPLSRKPRGGPNDLGPNYAVTAGVPVSWQCTGWQWVWVPGHWWTG